MYKLNELYVRGDNFGKTSTIQFVLNAEEKPYFEEAFFSPGVPYGGIYVLVAVYKINY